MQNTRLKMIYDLLPHGILCDVGTDHCRLAVMTLEGGKAPHVYATDINEGPLRAAAKTVAAHGLSDKITLLRSDGFEDIPEPVFETADCFAIAGMGGELIEHILRGRHTDKTLVLQPMSAVYELCSYLAAAGYEIQKRTFCGEGDKIYTAILCRYDGKVREDYPFYAVSRNADFYRFLDRELIRIDCALRGIEKSANADNERVQQLVSLRKIILSEERK